MTYKLVSRIGMGNLADIDTVPRVAVGSRIRAVDDSGLGEGEFIYMKGVASCALGDVVVFDETFQTVRGVAASRGQVGVAMAPILANQYGWFQVEGLAVVSVLTAFAADAICYLTATPGNVDDAVVAAQKIDGMRSQSAIGTPIASKAYIYLSQPAANGNGT